jgi:hypothetical protein
MDPEQEQFENLRRLLVLKRYEQPPPGFYHRFSRNVIVRIKAGERGEDVRAYEGLFAEPRWLQRILAAFETKPAVAGAFGLAMCGLLMAGVLYSENMGPAFAGMSPAAEQLPLVSQTASIFPSAPRRERFLGAAGEDSTAPAFGRESIFEVVRHNGLSDQPSVVPLVFKTDY